MALKTYHGSCACGAVKYEASFDIMAGTFKCNCSVCLKGRFWGGTAKVEDVHVTQGEDKLTLYGDRIKHHFCRVCGTKLFGKSGERSAVNLCTLDDLDPKEWTKAPVKYFDGKNDNWKSEPEFKEHL